MIEAKALNHVGIAVRSIRERRGFYENVLGAVFEGIEEVPTQRVRVGMFRVGPPGQAVRLELLEPTSPDSPVARFLEKRGEGLHHLAFAVDGIESRLAALGAARIRLIDERPRDGAHRSRIGFLHPEASGGVLVELCEE
jgi:methylmalonyl-CoA/ethylmalonyl-CoA epimerase